MSCSMSVYLNEQVLNVQLLSKAKMWNSFISIWDSNLIDMRRKR